MILMCTCSYLILPLMLMDKTTLLHQIIPVSLHTCKIVFVMYCEFATVGHVAKPPTERDVISLLNPIQSMWFEIGIALNVSTDTLNGLNADKSSNTIKLANVINTWIAKGDEVTWSALIEAVKGPIIGNKQIVDKIEEFLMK